MLVDRNEAEDLLCEVQVKLEEQNYDLLASYICDFRCKISENTPTTGTIPVKREVLKMWSNELTSTNIYYRVAIIKAIDNLLKGVNDGKV